MVILERLSDQMDLKEFISKLGKSKNSFRYFDRREANVIYQHLITLGFYIEGKLIGYGHLEKEKHKTWLGIAILPSHQGCGLGRRMMNALIANGIILGTDEISLTVDIDNISAINLYKKFGFKNVGFATKNSIEFILRLEPKKAQNIYLSSLIFNKDREHLDTICKSAIKWNLPLEFSSNVSFTSKNIKEFISYNARKLIHNYFPGDKNNLVLNLASSNDDIRTKSIDFCKRNIDLTSQYSTRNIYSIHIGFCIDPNFSELGNKIRVKNEFNRRKNYDIFINSVKDLCMYASSLNTELFLENNVITQQNLINNRNPLLGCEASEIISMMKDIDMPNCKLLLDTAHLKVSANSLNKNLQEEVNLLLPFIGGIHHSDNNGKIDSNGSIDSSYWFLEFLNHDSLKGNILHVVETKNNEIEEVFKQYNVLYDAIK